MWLCWKRESVDTVGGSIRERRGSVDWTIIGSVGELVGAGAVVVSLLYVGRQVRDSTTATRAEAYQALVAQLISVQAMVAQDERLSGALHRAAFDDASLTDFSNADSMSLTLLFASQARIYESLFKQVSEGVLDESALEMLSGLVILQSRAWAESWKRLRSTLDKDFVAYAETKHAFATGADPSAA
jgi:hypothetical protein